MLRVLETQHANLKFLVKLKNTNAKAHTLMEKVYGRECFSHMQVREWLFKHFKDGKEELENNPHQG